MNEVDVLKKFLSFPLSSTEEIFTQYQTIDGHIFSEYNANGKKRFLYVEGKRENKVLLVAHADTVYDRYYKEDVFVHTVAEKDGRLMAVDENGEPQLLGADDRAGIAMLWLLKDSGHSLLVTDGEEGARIGSKWLINKNKDIARIINEKHCFIMQLDRRNGRDFRCYNVGTAEFRSFIKEQTNYSEPEYGAPTDICSLCVDICGVNLSIGYYDNHSEYETLNLEEWMNTLQIVRKILSNENLPRFCLPRTSYLGQLKSFLWEI